MMISHSNDCTIELFSGTGSFSKVAKKQGFTCFTYDISETPEIKSIHTISDILDTYSLDYPLKPFIIWASPPCTTFSIASCSTHWTPEKEPKTEACFKGMDILDKTIEIIHLLKPTWWFIENPRGLMRKKIDPIFRKYGLNKIRHTITYCQYGDDRMKPTDIWTNFKRWNPRPMCKNGDSCHVKAPRGSRTGTQGIKGKRNRSRIPQELFLEIFKQLNTRIEHGCFTGQG